MYERITDRARKAMQLANQEAQRFGHSAIDTEHILLGLVEEDGVAIAMLGDADARRVRLEVEKRIQVGQSPTEGKIPKTPQAARVMENSRHEAERLRHSYIGTEHLLLGLLHETTGIAADVLKRLNVTLESARERLMELQRTGRQMSPHESQSDATGFHPMAVDEHLRRAVVACWQMLPGNRRSVAEVSQHIRRLVDRTLRDFEEDVQSFDVNR